MEGPFGDHTGYYSIPAPSSVFHVEEIYAKDNAVYAASVVGFPWSEDCVAGQFLMDYLRPLVKLINGNICDIFLPPEGAFTNMCLISVKKRFPGDAKKAMFSILGLGQLSLTKIIIAFDDDIDIRDLGRVMWALSTRIDPERDIQIIKGTSTDTLDHASNLSGYGSKMLIDATKKSAEEGYRRQWPGTIAPEPSILDEVERKWRQIK
jgi:4-hydroxy-3-polyprenylbenzoate decarboxylase